MCGIAGIINIKKGNVEGQKLALKTMIDRMAQRGPDGVGLYMEGHVGLAHRRLSIIDVKSGAQPITIDEGHITIVYNGEVYNFPEIKTTLEREGAIFKTNSDTEVIAVAYQYYGIEKCLRLLQGMYAFAIYDKRKGTVTIARDRYGVKPFYYSIDNDTLLFASELKAFAPSLKEYKICKKALNMFLTLSYIPSPYTIYEGIHKLMPGHYMVIEADGAINTKQYFRVTDPIKIRYNNDYESCKQELKDLVFASVKKRLVSDVPVGTFLSGGIDSSVVTCVMSRLQKEPVKTFSIGYDEQDYDESGRAELVAKHIGAEHHKYILRYDDVLKALDDIILYYDEPYGDSSAIPSYYVAKQASQEVKVVLTGDCADELFGGYEKYLIDYYVNKYKRIPGFLRSLFEGCVNLIPVNKHTNHLLRKIGKVIRSSKLTGFDLYYSMLSIGFTDELRKELLKPEHYEDIKSDYREEYNSLDKKLTFLQKEQLMDMGRMLEGQMFPKVDRACMHCSLENRAPFIDSEIVKFALNIPEAFKINGKDKKRILKETFKDILPEQTVGFSKKGFDVPVDYWFRNELKDELSELLSKDFIESQGLFNHAYINELLKDHLSRKKNNKELLWNLFVFQKWYRKNQELL